MKISCLASLAVLTFGVCCTAAAATSDCERTGVPAYRVTAPNGTASVLIGGMHSPFGGLCEPAASVMDGAKRYIVEGFSFLQATPETLEAPATALLRKITPINFPGKVRLDLVASGLPLAVWARALSKEEIVLLLERGACQDIGVGWAVEALKMESAQLASGIATRPCAQANLLSRDDVLAQAAVARQLPVLALETQPEADAHRRQIPERIHRYTVWRALQADAEIARRKTVDAINAGEYEEILEALFELSESSDDAELFANVMIFGRNVAWLPRLKRYLDEAPSVVNVGAAHLAGPSGLPALLADQGYKVEAIRLATAVTQKNRVIKKSPLK